MKALPVCTLVLLVVTSGVLGQVGQILQVIETPGPCPTGLAYDGKNLWVADAFDDRIYAIEAATGKVVRSFESPGYKPEGLAWDGQYLWHTDSGENLLYRLDVTTGSATKIVESGTGDPRDFRRVIDEYKYASRIGYMCGPDGLRFTCPPAVWRASPELTHEHRQE
jgi:DNA-binding beta-propeller fold protein YncE